MKFIAIILLISTTFVSWVSADELVDFEDLTVFSPGSGNSYYNGNIDGTDNFDGWSSGGVFIDNGYYADLGGFPFWYGMAYSNVIDDTTAGFFNQYASFAGGGSDGQGGADPGGMYAVASVGAAVEANGTPLGGSTFTLPESSLINSIDVSNTTYTALYIRDGLDGFGVPDSNPFHQFESGDFYRLFITGFDGINGTGSETDTVTVELASNDDFLLSGWHTIDMTSLGMVRSVKLSVTSSQISTFSGGQFSRHAGIRRDRQLKHLNCART